ncbi:MAG: hypothetical protein U9Q62_02785 [Campylobacterota bacterium]|nr:hypothetical protein [Campylobacterota bacterium]
MLKIAGSLFTVLLFLGCEEKAVPVTDQPSEAHQEEHEQGYISTH